MGNVDPNIFYDNLRNVILKEFEGDSDQLDAVEGLGLLEEVPVFKVDTPLDTLSHFLSKKLAFGTLEGLGITERQNISFFLNFLEKGERDLVILRLEVIARWPDGKREFRGINLVSHGDETDDGYSAMSRAVGYPAAIATKMIIDGQLYVQLC